jgi:ABC-type sugar transport system ATPase subunit
LVPADRKSQGLMLDRSVEWNISQVVFGALKGRWWLSSRAMRAASNRQIKGMNIKARDGRANVVGLSGGNQQKVVIGKWLEISPRVFLLDDPTRGVDVGAKAEIYKLIRDLSADGAIVLFRSSELPELVGLADRVLVMYRGHMVGEISGESATDARLLGAINTGQIEAA